MKKIETLKELLDVLNTKSEEEILSEYGYTMDSLPTFGGAEPEDTMGVWSWDENFMIVDLGGGVNYLGNKFEIVLKSI
jgi:hypothetical protein